MATVLFSLSLSQVLSTSEQSPPPSQNIFIPSRYPHVSLADIDWLVEEEEQTLLPVSGQYLFFCAFPCGDGQI